MLATAGCPAARRARNVPMRPDPMMPSPISRVRVGFATGVTGPELPSLVRPGKISSDGAKTYSADDTV
jgi:hypothetical protein